MLSRRDLLSGLAFSSIAMRINPLLAAIEPTGRLRLSGPPASVSDPLIHMATLGKWPGLAEQIEFTAWADPDQLRALALRKTADFVAMPTNVAANLYNRGVPLKLVNVSVWGILFIVSRDAGRTRLADYRGEEIAIPFREDMPDLIFQELAEAQGLDPHKAFKIRYVGSPLDAMQLLLTRRVHHALLAEPAVSMALLKTRSLPMSVVAPKLYRALDLQQEWARVFKRSSRIPQAGIVALSEAAQTRERLRLFQQAYTHAAQWCLAHRECCGAEVAAREPRLSAEAVAESLGVTRLDSTPALAARDELRFLFERLLRRNPQLLGGKLPDDGFFASA